MPRNDVIYKCLSPVGLQLMSIQTYPLAPRLDKLDGKTIFVSIGAGGEQDITIPLPKKLQEKYPNVNWQITRAAAHLTVDGSVALTEEQIRTADGLIRGVVW
jgi:hypothetical protein